MSTLIAQAAASTATVAVQEVVESRRLRRKQTISELEIEISELQRRLGDFLPVEQAAKNRCNSEIERTHKELKQLYSLDVVDDMDEKAAAVQEEGYAALD
ncbi:MAG: hypothetical protein KDD62_09805, partial [Bdellovibrionales bacterium]|nr:hypothetical protein [Bdellovibrionales bacterium]